MGTHGIAAGTGRLRLLSFNIQAGAVTQRYREYVTRGWQHVLPLGKSSQLDRLAAHLGDYDVVGLQEADAGSLRSGFINQAEYLAERAGFPFWSQQENRRLGVIASSSNSLLSRLQPTEVHDHRLPGRVRGRGALLALFGQPPNQLAVVVAHLSLGQNSRTAQFGFLRELIWPYPHVVLMGDFNCAGEHPRFLRFLLETGLRQAGHPAPPTFPSWQPQRAIDHVLVSAGLHAVDYQALPLKLSDHLPVSVELELPDELADLRSGAHLRGLQTRA